MNWTRSSRVAIVFSLLIGILVFAGVLLGMVIVYLLPDPAYIEIGRLSDYPPAPDPYDYRDEIGLFIIHDGTEIIALDRKAEDLRGFPINVRWQSKEKFFINPFGGTHYLLNGCPYWWALNFETVSPMVRYPVDIQGDQIRVEVSDPFPACQEMFNTLTLGR